MLWRSSLSRRQHRVSRRQGELFTTGSQSNFRWPRIVEYVPRGGDRSKKRWNKGFLVHTRETSARDTHGPHRHSLKRRIEFYIRIGCPKDEARRRTSRGKAQRHESADHSVASETRGRRGILISARFLPHYFRILSQLLYQPHNIK